MNHKILLPLLLIFSILSYDTFAQSHYIFVVDRIKNTQTFKQKEFKNGRSVEKDINKPEIKQGDIITVRMVNFNELIYGLDVEEHSLVKKPETMISSVLSSSTALMATSFSPYAAAGVMNDLARNMPAVSRGEETESAAVQIQRRLVEYLGQIIDVENDISSFYFDEGLTLDEEKVMIGNVDKKYNSKAILNNYNKIKYDAKTLLDSNSMKWADIDAVLSDYNEDYVNELEDRIKNIKQALREVDFISECTFPVSENQNENNYFDKFNLKIKIYKRATPLVTKTEAQRSNKKYNYNDGVEYGDQLNQCIDISLKVKNKYKPYFSIGVNRIAVPDNRYSYNIDNYSYIDSIKFKSSAAGGAKTSIGLSLNFDIPFHSKNISVAGSVGYSMAFWKSAIGNDGDNSNKKGFVTTGINIGLKKFQFVNLSFGCAWGEYAQLSSNYQADKFIPNNLSDAEISSAITKKIRPAFYFGLNMPVW